MLSALHQCSDIAYCFTSCTLWCTIQRLTNRKHEFLYCLLPAVVRCYFIVARRMIKAGVRM
jgi:hypothetical protein